MEKEKIILSVTRGDDGLPKIHFGDDLKSNDIGDFGYAIVSYVEDNPESLMTHYLVATLGASVITLLTGPRNNKIAARVLRNCIGRYCFGKEDEK